MMHATDTTAAWFKDQIESVESDTARKLRELIRGAEGYLEAIESGLHVPGGYDLARLGQQVEASVAVRSALYAAAAATDARS